MADDKNLISILNEANFRKELCSNMPELEKIDNLDCIKELRLVSMKAGHSLALLKYEAIALPEAYSNMTESLGEKLKFTIMSGPRINKGKLDEHRLAKIHIHDSLTADIKIYNPKYEFDDSDIFGN